MLASLTFAVVLGYVSRSRTCMCRTEHSAYQTALTLPLSVLGPDPYLKLSGIAAVLAEVAPERRAKEVLRSVWDMGGASRAASSDSPDNNDSTSNRDSSGEWATYTLTNEERLRRAAVACKLAELCANEDGKEEEERWLVWAVEEVLRLAGVSADGTSHSESASTSVVLAELELPSWMRRADLGAPLAALGSVYAQKGNVE